MKRTLMKRLRIDLLGLSAAVVLFQSPNAAELKVPSQYLTIQSAVDAADTNDVIRIAPGVYSEQIFIESKKLSLIGSPGTIIRSSQFLLSWSPDVQLNFELPHTVPLLGAVLSDVTLRNIAFEGENLGDYYTPPESQEYWGLQFLRSNVDIENCSLTGFRETVEGTNSSTALGIGSMHPDTNTARIVGCTFANNANAIYMRASTQMVNLTVTLENNTIIGPGPSTNSVISTGIALREGVSGRVANNRISGFSYVGPARNFPVNFGILADNEGNFPAYGVLDHVELIGNTFEDNQIHIAMIRGDGCVISNNVFQTVVPGPLSAAIVVSGKKTVIARNRFEDLTEGIRLFGIDPNYGELFHKAESVQLKENRFCNVAKPITLQPTATAVQSGTLLCPYPPPTLEIQPSVLVSWPSEETGWTLQSATSAQGPWSDAPGTRFEQDGKNNLSIPTVAEKLFFRLR